MEIKVSEEIDSMQWNNYVQHHNQSCIYHRFEWAMIFSKIYRHKPIYLLAEQKGNIVGILPMILVDSFLSGRVMISMPYFGFGGIVADNNEVIACLLEKVKEIGRQLRVKQLELRQVGYKYDSLPYRNDKVLMVLDLAKTSEEQMKLLHQRLRNKVRNAMKFDFSTQIGKDFQSFFRVYSENMRYLGTPCHSQRLFATILETFQKDSFTVTIFHDSMPVASAIALIHKDTVDIPCVSSLREWNKHEANTKLYWSLIEYACNEGFKKLSFGRSSINGGTYEFKRRWGAVPYELPYSYLYFTSSPKNFEVSQKNDEGVSQNNEEGIKTRIIKNIWRKLPLPVTQYLGPKILRHLPSPFFG